MQSFREDDAIYRATLARRAKGGPKQILRVLGATKQQWHKQRPRAIGDDGGGEDGITAYGGVDEYSTYRTQPRHTFFFWLTLFHPVFFFPPDESRKLVVNHGGKGKKGASLFFMSLSGVPCKEENPDRASSGVARL